MYLDAFQRLLERVFECFPDLDYCLLACPPKTIHAELMRYFTKATPKSSSNLPYDLFILHRAVLNCHMTVSWVTGYDLHEINQIVSNIKKKDRFMNYVKMAIEHPKHKVKVFKLQIVRRQILGVALVRPMDIWPCLKYRYDLQHIGHIPYNSGDDVGIIEYFILSPIFKIHGEYFIKEIFRLGDYKSLFYILTYDELCLNKNKRSLHSLLGKYLLEIK